ncbi:MAG: DUF805 domain-containing protein [Patescibacteria group bacterium]|nr:DUF805 domain-containing protein [Patescibacteria group bacterium]
MNDYISALKKYAEFKGRSSRKEYWMFFLFNLIALIILIVIDIMTGLTTQDGRGILSSIYQLAVLIPSIALGIRRMHDVNKSGWFLIIPIYSLVLTLTGGTKGENQYGPDPKSPAKV